MKLKTKHYAALIASVALAIGSYSVQAQYVGPTNQVIYNFDSDQVTGIWGNWFGGMFVDALWDPGTDAANNPSSGSLRLDIAPAGGDQYVLWDVTPAWGPFNVQTIWTNLSFDMRYDETSAIRTNSTAAGVNGSQGPGSLDFGFMRYGSRNSAFNQDWIQYFAVPATNGAGLPNTNWIHQNMNLQGVTGTFPDLSSGLVDFIIGMDGNAFGNNVLVGPQIIWFDNFTFNGYAAPVPPPSMSIIKATPALRMFGGSGQFGRAQLAITAFADGWVDGTFPVSYSFKALDNATSPGGLDYHIHFIQNFNGYSGADYTSANVLWLQILSGAGTNTSCVANVSWKTNTPNTNPNQTAGGAVALQITNPVLAGTWTLTFLSPSTGTLTAPGASPVAFTIADPTVATDFAEPIEVRFGIQNNGNTGNGGIPHDWANISISGTTGTNFVQDFTTANSNQIDTNIWDLTRSDGVGVLNLVPTNAPYWVRTTLPDSAFFLVTATNTAGPWVFPEFYNNFYSDGFTNTVATQTTQAGGRWNLILPTYLPTANGVPGGPASPKVFFAMRNPPPAP